MSYRLCIQYVDGSTIETFHSQLSWAREEARKAERRTGIKGIQIFDNATDEEMAVHPRKGIDSE